MHLKIETLPSGLKVVSGGTRMSVCLNRPWQLPLASNVCPQDCPFEGNNFNGKAERFPDTGWLAIDNPNTAHSFHKLIMPEKCWQAKRLQRLGGSMEIRNALSIAARFASSQKNADLLMAVQVGLSAGQSKGHLHYHLQNPQRLGKRAPVARFLKQLDPRLAIETNGQWLGVLGGKYAGQCFILPRNRAYLSDGRKMEALSVTVSNIVDRYNRTLVSVQGQPPDFSLSFIIRHGHVEYGCYIPTLYHQWGANDKMADIEGWAVILPWPHEATLKHLLG